MQAHNKNIASRRRLSIFIADDNADTVLTLATLLRDEQHVVHTCANANLVLEAVQRYKPEVCILDVVMPGKSGFALARQIGGLALPKRPVLIALSGVFNKPSDKPLLEAAGFDHVIAKSSDASELLALVEHIAGGELPPAA